MIKKLNQNLVFKNDYGYFYIYTQYFWYMHNIFIYIPYIVLYACMLGFLVLSIKAQKKNIFIFFFKLSDKKLNITSLIADH